MDTTPPKTFTLVSPTSWINNQTPNVIISFVESTSGVNLTSVEWAYSTTGNPYPNELECNVGGV